jgi:hypothetical protein
MAQRLAMTVKERAERRLAGRLFAKQSTITDFSDVAGLQVDRNRKTIFELE